MKFEDVLAGRQVEGAQRHEPLAVSEGVVAGVPTFWVPSNGPTSAALVFRAGRVDEPIARAGVTKVVENVVRSAVDLPLNRGGDLRHTSFVYSGDQDDLVLFFRRIGELVFAFPHDRAGAVAAELATDLGSFEPTAFEMLLQLRHGTRGVGAAGHQPVGYVSTGGRMVEEWHRAYFHIGNAALWVSGPFPQSLSLRLPDPMDAVHGMTPTPTLPIATPGAFHYGNGAAVSLVARSSEALAAASWIVAQRWRVDERPTPLIVRKERLDAETCEMFFILNTSEEERREALHALLTHIEEIATSGPYAREIETYRDSVAGTYFDESAAMAHAQTAVADHFFGIKTVDWATRVQQLHGLSTASVRDALLGALPTALIAGPPVPATESRFSVVTPIRTQPIAGAEIKPVKQDGERKLDRSLVASVEGLTLRTGATTTTVRFDQCAGVIRRKNGVRELIADDGGRVLFVPWLWAEGDTLRALIDKAVADTRMGVILDDAVAATEAVADPPAPRRHIPTWRKVVAAAAVLSLLGGGIGLAWRLTHQDDITAAAQSQQGVSSLPLCSEVDVTMYAEGEKIRCQDPETMAMAAKIGSLTGVLAVGAFAFRARRVIAFVKRMVG